MQRFVELWTHPDSPPSPISQVQLDEAQRALGVNFPESYCDAVIECGVPHTSFDFHELVKSTGFQPVSFS